MVSVLLDVGCRARLPLLRDRAKPKPRSYEDLHELVDQEDQKRLRHHGQALRTCYLTKILELCCDRGYQTLTQIAIGFIADPSTRHYLRSQIDVEGSDPVEERGRPLSSVELEISDPKMVDDEAILLGYLLNATLGEDQDGCVSSYKIHGSCEPTRAFNQPTRRDPAMTKLKSYFRTACKWRMRRPIGCDRLIDAILVAVTDPHYYNPVYPRWTLKIACRYGLAELCKRLLPNVLQPPLMHLPFGTTARMNDMTIQKAIDLAWDNGHERIVGILRDFVRGT